MAAAAAAAGGGAAGARATHDHCDAKQHIDSTTDTRRPRPTEAIGFRTCETRAVSHLASHSPLDVMGERIRSCLFRKAAEVLHYVDSAECFHEAE